jgi:TIR domain
MAGVFISYTSSDRDWALWIAKELEAFGHTPHVHEWEVNGGDDIYGWMERYHDAADHVLCVVSEIDAALTRYEGRVAITALPWRPSQRSIRETSSTIRLRGHGPADWTGSLWRWSGAVPHRHMGQRST